MKTEAFFLLSTGDADKTFQRRLMELPDPEPDEILISVEAFGLNYADVMARKGLYRDAPPLPAVIGYEVVGRIVAVGKECKGKEEGQRVVAFCRFGGYSRHVITRAVAAVVVKDEPAIDLLALCTQGVTAYYMARYLLNIRQNDNVLVHAAAGGVGTMLVQLAKADGARVIAKVGGEHKKETVLQLGADKVVNYRESDYVQEIRSFLGGNRLDVSFNPVAGSTFKEDMSLLRSGGRIVLFGASELGKGRWGFLSKLNFVRKMGLIIPAGLMIKSKNVLGVNMLCMADDRPEVLEECMNAVVDLYGNGKLRPQSGGVFPAERLAEAHSALESGKTIGKLAVIW